MVVAVAGCTSDNGDSSPSATSTSSPSATSTAITIEGLVGADGATISVDRAKKLPDILDACLPASGQISVDDFRSDCLMPYINGLWVSSEGLLRPHAQLAEAAKDWLVKKPEDGKWPIYYPANGKAARQDLTKQLADNSGLKSTIRIAELPKKLPKPSADPQSIYNQAGLMYLPNDYVVPGGIFNEQYGWDSFFIIMGLLRSAEWVLENRDSTYWDPAKSQLVQLDDDAAVKLAQELFAIAKGMTDNHAFMIDFYGGLVPNANRIYYLTRSQPPLFAHEANLVYEFAERYPDAAPYQETLAPYLKLDDPPTNYEEWIEREILPAAKKYFDYYTDPKTTTFGAPKNPRVAKSGGRTWYQYSPDGVGPAPEIVNSQVPGNANLYKQYAAYFTQFPKSNPQNRFYDPDSGDPVYGLTQDFYLADRTVRASGYDLSGRYGEVGQYAADFAPVDLNSLLFQMAQDMNTMAETVGQSPSVDQQWLDDLSAGINTDMWVTDAAGPYYSDRLVRKGSTAKQPYLYGTTFAPLWSGVVPDSRWGELTDSVETPEEIKQNQVFYITRNGEIEPDVERATGELKTCKLSDPDNPGSCSGRFTTQSLSESALIADSNFGIPTSLRATGNQWDFSNAWAPVQLFAAQGFREANRGDLADQVDTGWLNTVEIGFASSGTIIEKYSSLNPVQDVQVTSGYSKPQVGFGWTNAVYLEAFLENTQ